MIGWLDFDNFAFAVGGDTFFVITGGDAYHPRAFFVNRNNKWLCVPVPIKIKSTVLFEENMRSIGVASREGWSSALAASSRTSAPGPWV